MRCNKAQYLMAFQQDGELSDRQARRLREHLQSCDDCRNVYLHLSASASMLAEDSSELKRAELSSGFATSLSCALAEESNQRSLLRATLVDSLYEAIVPRKMRGYVRMASTAAAIIALWIGIAHFALPSGSLPAGPAQCHFGHLASFNTRASSDQRVFASLSERRSVDRDTSREAWQK